MDEPTIEISDVDIGMTAQTVTAPVHSPAPQISAYASSITSGGCDDDTLYFDITFDVSVEDCSQDFTSSYSNYKSFRVVKRIAIDKNTFTEEIMQNTNVTVVEQLSGGFLNDPKTLSRFKKLAGV